MTASADGSSVEEEAIRIRDSMDSEAEEGSGEAAAAESARKHQTQSRQSNRIIRRMFFLGESNDIVTCVNRKQCDDAGTGKMGGEESPHLQF